MSRRAMKSSIWPPCTAKRIGATPRAPDDSFPDCGRANRGRRRVGRNAAAAAALCVLTSPFVSPEARAVSPAMQALDPALAARIQALSPDNVSEADVRDTLSRVEAPRII